MSRSEVIWAAVLSAYDIGGASATTLYYATRGFNTAGGDTPADTHFAERIIGLSMPTRSMWSEGGTFGRMTPGDGELFLANGDGDLDAVMGYGLDGRTLTIYRGYAGDAFPGSWTKYVYVMDWPEEGVERIRIRFREKGSELDTPFQTTLYTASGDLEGDAALKGKPKPYLLGGGGFNIPAVLVNATKSIYQVHDGALASLEDVRDSGRSLGKTSWAWGSVTSGTANDLYAIASYGDVVVAVGASGTIIRSTDGGANWSAASTPSFSTTDVRCVAYSPSLDVWVAGGASGKLAYSSDDGDTWTQITAGSNPFGGAETVRGVAWGDAPAVFLAVGDAGVTATSANGTAFTNRANGFGGSAIHSVVFGRNTFVAGGADGKMQTTPDGVTYTSRTSGFTSGQYINALAYGRGKFVAAGSSMATSEDAIGWTADTAAPTGVQAAAYSEVLGQFVAAGVSTVYPSFVMASATGQGWQVRSGGLASPKSWYSVCGTDALVLVGGAAGSLYDSNTSGTYASEADLLDDDLAPDAGTFKAYLTGGYFRLGSPAVGEVTCDATAGATAADRTHAQLFVDALTEAGKSSGDWSAADITAADSANASVAALWIGPDERPTTAQVIDRVAQSCGAWWGTDRTGVYRFQIVVAPAGTADAELAQADILRLYRMPERGQVAVPPYQTVIRYLQNYTPQTSGLADGVTDANRALYAREWRVEKNTNSAVQTKHLKSDELVVDSVFATSAGASTEASRVQTLRGTERQRYEFRVEDDDTLCLLDLNDVVNITYARFDLTSGKKFLVVGVKPEPGTGLLLLKAWG